MARCSRPELRLAPSVEGAVDMDTDANECFARETVLDEPSNAWDLMKLEQYAQTQHEAIVQGERTLAPAYHRLGRALEMLRRKRGRGSWYKYLESLGIHPVRACKARAIARHFSSAQAVAEMPVEEAYLASKKQRSKVSRRSQDGEERGNSQEESQSQDTARSSEAIEVDEVEAFLANIGSRADTLIDTVAFMDQAKRKTLFSAYQDALKRLQSLGRLLGFDDQSDFDKKSSSISSKARRRAVSNPLGIL